MKTVIAIATLSFLTGCLANHPYQPDYSPNGSDPLVPLVNNVREAEDGHLQGDIGPARNLDNKADILNAYDDGVYLSVETVVRSPARTAMTIFSATNSAELKPGFDQTIRYDQLTQGATMNLLGCTGQSVGVYDEYDQPADELQVTVTEGPADNVSKVNLTAKWFERDIFTGNTLPTFNQASTSFNLVDK